MNHYTVSSCNPAGHYFDVTLDIPSPDAGGQLLRLPAWIPGSYMIRDFARNLLDLTATRGGQPVTLRQVDKSSWQLAAGEGPCTVSYRVYAWDLSVRGAHLDTTHGFFNGASLFLEVVGQGDQPCSVDISRPQADECAQWRLATTLPRQGENGSEEPGFDFGLFEADDYQQLIDHPVEMGNFIQCHYHACGIRHDVVLSGRFNCDTERMTSDLEKICSQHIRMFGEPAPMPRYLFLVMVVGDGYGGLEHRDSTSLMCSRNDLPQPGQSELTDEYRGFLGLCSHEYFHSWNVKRIRPAVFHDPDLSTEVYTTLLWAFEGITSYYDDLALLRSGCIGRDDYLELLGQTITRVQRGLGRTRQSVSESSFNAWTRFYKQDENAPNSIVSYYTKGSMIALCIDLEIRRLSAGARSLDDVMRLLWVDYLENGVGVDEAGLRHAISEVAGTDLSVLLTRMIDGAEEPPLAELLQTVSIRLNLRPANGSQDKGGKDSEKSPAGYIGAQVKEVAGSLQVASLTENAPAQQAGLSAADQIVAINGLRASLKSYQHWLLQAQPGSRHQLTVFRRDELMQFEVEIAEPPADTAWLSVIDENHPALNDWLHRPSQDADV